MSLTNLVTRGLGTVHRLLRGRGAAVPPIVYYPIYKFNVTLTRQRSFPSNLNTQFSFSVNMTTQRKFFTKIEDGYVN